MCAQMSISLISITFFFVTILSPDVRVKSVHGFTHTPDYKYDFSLNNPTPTAVEYICPEGYVVAALTYDFLTDTIAVDRSQGDDGCMFVDILLSNTRMEGIESCITGLHPLIGVRTVVDATRSSGVRNIPVCAKTPKPQCYISGTYRPWVYSPAPMTCGTASPPTCTLSSIGSFGSKHKVLTALFAIDTYPNAYPVPENTPAATAFTLDASACTFLVSNTPNGYARAMHPMASDAATTDHQSETSSNATASAIATTNNNVVGLTTEHLTSSSMRAFQPQYVFPFLPNPLTFLWPATALEWIECGGTGNDAMQQFFRNGTIRCAPLSQGNPLMFPSSHYFLRFSEYPYSEPFRSDRFFSSCEVHNEIFLRLTIMRSLDFNEALSYECLNMAAHFALDFDSVHDAELPLCNEGYFLMQVSYNAANGVSSKCVKLKTRTAIAFDCSPRCSGGVRFPVFADGVCTDLEGIIGGVAAVNESSTIHQPLTCTPLTEPMDFPWQALPQIEMLWPQQALSATCGDGIVTTLTIDPSTYTFTCYDIMGQTASIVLEASSANVDGIPFVSPLAHVSIVFDHSVIVRNASQDEFLPTVHPLSCGPSEFFRADPTNPTGGGRQTFFSGFEPRPPTDALGNKPLHYRCSTWTYNFVPLGQSHCVSDTIALDHLVLPLKQMPGTADGMGGQLAFTCYSEPTVPVEVTAHHSGDSLAAVLSVPDGVSCPPPFAMSNTGECLGLENTYVASETAQYVSFPYDYHQSSRMHPMNGLNGNVKNNSHREYQGGRRMGAHGTAVPYVTRNVKEEIVFVAETTITAATPQSGLCSGWAFLHGENICVSLCPECTDDSPLPIQVYKTRCDNSEIVVGIQRNLVACAINPIQPGGSEPVVRFSLESDFYIVAFSANGGPGVCDRVGADAVVGVHYTRDGVGSGLICSPIVVNSPFLTPPPETPPPASPTPSSELPTQASQTTDLSPTALPPTTIAPSPTTFPPYTVGVNDDAWDLAITTIAPPGADGGGWSTDGSDAHHAMSLATGRRLASPYYTEEPDDGSDDIGKYALSPPGEDSGGGDDGDGGSAPPRYIVRDRDIIVFQCTIAFMSIETADKAEIVVMFAEALKVRKPSLVLVNLQAGSVIVTVELHNASSLYNYTSADEITAAIQTAIEDKDSKLFAWGVLRDSVVAAYKAVASVSKTLIRYLSNADGTETTAQIVSAVVIAAVLAGIFAGTLLIVCCCIPACPLYKHRCCKNAMEKEAEREAVEEEARLHQNKNPLHQNQQREESDQSGDRGDEANNAVMHLNGETSSSAKLKSAEASQDGDGDAVRFFEGEGVGGLNAADTEAIFELLETHGLHVRPSASSQRQRTSALMARNFGNTGTPIGRSSRSSVDTSDSSPQEPNLDHQQALALFLAEESTRARWGAAAFGADNVALRQFERDGGAADDDEAMRTNRHAMQPIRMDNSAFEALAGSRSRGGAGGGTRDVLENRELALQRRSSLRAVIVDDGVDVTDLTHDASPLPHHHSANNNNTNRRQNDVTRNPHSTVRVERVDLEPKTAGDVARDAQSDAVHRLLHGGIHVPRELALPDTASEDSDVTTIAGAEGFLSSGEGAEGVSSFN